ncbi:hypothetical protein L249_6530 [Ophiocordyceps polyrhachis-furcata BCC 54312]|uniref:Uncharacterized protein n=1 Tax=Ophiocordyceps polyrhachis-furcata BCC 54312 TaxID=1330021 RepID=A0A367LK73_9HYPO|nr:hypothetical protein L249_6530 [Ophiocordyceps polyrhachis-furcata BCC 54312]
MPEFISEGRTPITLNSRKHDPFLVGKAIDIRGIDWKGRATLAYIRLLAATNNAWELALASAVCSSQLAVNLSITVLSFITLSHHHTRFWLEPDLAAGEERKKMGHNTSKCNLLTHYSTLSNYACQHMGPASGVPLNLFEWNNIALLAPINEPYAEVSWTSYLEKTLPEELLQDFAIASNLSMDAYLERLTLNYNRSKTSYTFVLVDLYSYSRYAGVMCWPKVKLDKLIGGYRSHLGALVNLAVPKHSLYGKWTAKPFPSAPRFEFDGNATHCISPDDPYFRDVHAVISLEMQAWFSFKTNMAGENIKTAEEIFMSYSHPFIKAFGKSFYNNYACTSLKGCFLMTSRGEAWRPDDMWGMVSKTRQLLDEQLPVCIMLGSSVPPAGFYTINSPQPKLTPSLPCPPVSASVLESTYDASLHLVRKHGLKAQEKPESNH